MKLVIFSDTHGRHNKLNMPNGDVLIFGGDLASGGSIDDILKFDDFLQNQPHPHKILIAGNCDFAFESSPQAAIEALESARYLQDDEVSIDGKKFWGSPWQPRFLDMAFNLPRGNELEKTWAKIPDDTDILITHTPPAGILDKTSRGSRVGCEALKKRIQQLDLDLHIFGHIHESRGTLKKDGTQFINAACNGPDEEPFVVEL